MSYCKSASRGSALLAAFLLSLQLAPVLVLADEGRIERPDENHYFSLHDWDVYDGRLRFLFQTKPSRDQYLSDPPNWPDRLFVTEVEPGGGHTTYALGTSDMRRVSFVLRRGHPEVFAIEKPREPNGPHHLQVWNIYASEMTRSTALPQLPHQPHYWDIHPTSDGHFFSVGSNSQTTGGYQGPVNLTWTKTSAFGKTLASGELMRKDAQLGAKGWFMPANGGVGLVVSLVVAAENAKSLDTEIDTPIRRKIGGEEVEAHVMTETRLLITDANAKLRIMSSALERSVMFDFEFASDDPAAMREYLRLSEERTRAIQDIEKTHAFGARQIAKVTGRNELLVKANARRYGMLSQQPGGPRTNPDRFGTWYLEFADDGTPQRELYLQPIADKQEGRIVDFLAEKDGGLLLLGDQGPAGMSVSRASSTGELEWTYDISGRVDHTEPAGLVRSGNRLWVFGRSLQDQGHATLWLTDVDPATARRSISTSIPENGSNPERVSAPTGAFEMPACACTCEEGDAINQALASAQQVRTAADIEAMENNPAMQKMMCLAMCQAEYAVCK